MDVRNVSMGRGADALRFSQESGHSDMNRGAVGRAPVTPGAWPRSPDAAMRARANGRLSRKTRSTIALSSGNSNP